MGIPSLVAPSSRTWPGIAREAATGTPVLPTNTIPLEKSSYEPEDMPHFLDDLAIRGSMSHRFATILGVEDANFSYGGPFFGDTYPFFADNLFGDLSTTGSSPTSATTTTELLAVGATATTVSTISGYSSGSIVQIDSGSLAEVVVLSGAPSGSTLTFTGCPLRFPHSTAATVASYLTLWLVLLACLRATGVSQAQVPWQTSLAAFAFIRLLTALPITPGGVGITELGLVGILTAGAGHPVSAQVTAAVLLYRAVTYLPPIPLGALACLLWRHAPALIGPSRREPVPAVQRDDGSLQPAPPR